MLQHPILKVACVNLIMSWTTAILYSFSQETDLLIKVIMKSVNIKLSDILGCFHYILNASRILRNRFKIQKLLSREKIKQMF